MGQACDLLGLLEFCSKRKKKLKEKGEQKKNLQINLIRTTTQKMKHLSYYAVKHLSLWCTVKKQLCFPMEECKLLPSHPVENSESFTAGTAGTPRMTLFSTHL